jgi:hypothetical protein
MQLYERAYKKNRLKNYGFTIPCVCLSTILASATFALILKIIYNSIGQNDT